MNLVTIPHPVWFAVVDVVIYLPLALLGCRVAGFVGKRSTAQTRQG